jgi:hypothetical protein
MFQTVIALLSLKFRKSLFTGIQIILLCLLINTNPVNAQWVPTSGTAPGVPVKCFTVKNNILFTGTWGGTYGNGGAYRSTNYGANWVAINSGLTDTAVMGYAVSGSYLFAGTFGGVFRSTNEGTAWSQVNFGLTNTNVYTIVSNGTDLYAGTNDGVFRSSNNGSSWGFTGLAGYLVDAFEVIGSNVFAGTLGFGVFRTSNSGVNWTEVNSGLSNQAVQCLTSIGTNLYAGTFSGVFRSTNNGANWSASGLSGTMINTLAVSGTNIFAGFAGGGVYLSTNSGTNWTAVGVGIPNTMVNTLFVKDTLIFAGTLSGTIYKRPLSEMVTSVNMLSNELPDKFSLNQNYPNPFNPSTNIKFDISKSSFVRISIFDVSGKEVTVLVNEQLQPGTYQTDWNASAYSSGVYFCKIAAEKYTDTKRMVLIK